MWLWNSSLTITNGQTQKFTITKSKNLFTTPAISVFSARWQLTLQRTSFLIQPSLASWDYPIHWMWVRSPVCWNRHATVMFSWGSHFFLCNFQGATARVVQHSLEFEEALAVLVLMTAPMAPHLSSELWAGRWHVKYLHIILEMMILKMCREWNALKNRENG